MDPFEYGKSFHNKSYPKRIGTLSPPDPKIDTLKLAGPNRVNTASFPRLRLNQPAVSYSLSQFKVKKLSRSVSIIAEFQETELCLNVSVHCKTATNRMPI